MSDAVTATRAPIQIGSITVDGFMLPDGFYRMSLSQVAESVDLTARNAFDFLKTKALKRLLGEDYTVSISQVEISPDGQSRGQSRFDALPLEIVSAYWLWQAHRNKKALSLCMGLITESLERRFDSAFNVERTEEERNDRLTQRLGELEAQMSALSEAYTEPDDLRELVSRLEDQLRQAGLEPWTSPNDD